MMLDQDDVIRRDIIQQIMCQFRLDFNQIANKYELNFAEYFVTELADLPALVELGLITLNATSLEVSSKGRFLIRNIAVVFDKYLRQRQDNKRYSKVI
jgi:oxygen-independent coproporphyrinogen-3 oxidase